MATAFERVFELKELRELIVSNLDRLETVARAEAVSTLFRDSVARVFWPKQERLEVTWRRLSTVDEEHKPTFHFTLNSDESDVDARSAVDAVEWFARRCPRLKLLSLAAPSIDLSPGFSDTNIDAFFYFETVSTGLLAAADQICQALLTQPEWCSGLESLRLNGAFYCSPSGVRLLQRCRQTVSELSVAGEVWTFPKFFFVWPGFWQHNANDYLHVLKQCARVQSVSLSCTNVGSESEPAAELLRDALQALPSLRQLSMENVFERHISDNQALSLFAASSAPVSLARVETVRLATRYGGGLHGSALLNVPAACARLRRVRVRAHSPRSNVNPTEWRRKWGSAVADCAERWLQLHRADDEPTSLAVDFVESEQHFVEGSRNGDRERFKAQVRRLLATAEFSQNGVEMMTATVDNATVTIAFPVENCDDL